MALVEIRSVHKSFQRGEQKIDVFTDLTLDVGEGAFLALMGPSGSGKSTLLNLLAGLDRPSSGSVRVAGAEVSAMSAGQLAAWRARHISFVFQQLNLLDMSIVKRFEITQSVRAQLHLEVYNATNQTFFDTPNLNPRDANFGKVTSQSNVPVNLQLGFRVFF